MIVALPLEWNLSDCRVHLHESKLHGSAMLIASITKPGRTPHHYALEPFPWHEEQQLAELVAQVTRHDFPELQSLPMQVRRQREAV